MALVDELEAEMKRRGLTVDAQRQPAATGLLGELQQEAERRKRAVPPPAPQEPAGFDLEGFKAEQRARLEATPEGQAQLAEINRARQFQPLPEARGRAGAFGSGFRRTLTDIGTGAAQVGTGIAEQAGADVGQLPERLAEVATTSRERFEAETAERPGFGLTGQLAGFAAALPAAPKSVLGAGALGATTGLLLPTETADGTSQRAINTLLGAGGGALFQAALPFAGRLIAAGGRKGASLIRGMVQSVAGSAGTDFVSSKGILTSAGREALEAVGVNVDDLMKVAAQADTAPADDLQGALFRSLHEAGEKQLEPQSAARIARAQAEGIPLTSGQAQQDFGKQVAENTLRGLTVPGSFEARAAATQAQTAIKGAVNKFVSRFGDEFQGVPVNQQGAAIKAGIESVKTASRSNVQDLYLAAEQTAGGNVPVQITNLAEDAIDDVIERSATPQTERSLLSAFARFGLIGDTPVEKGAGTVVDFFGEKIKFRGGVTPLTLSNAETFRQSLNKAMPADRTGVVAATIERLDNAIEETLETAVSGADRTTAFKAARGGFREFKQVFSAKDIVDELVAFKTGTRTPRIDESIVVSKIFNARNATENIDRVKRALLASAPDPKTRAAGRVAWREFQQSGVDHIFRQAVSPIGQEGAISGARLNTAVRRMGEPALRKLMTQEQFVSFKNLQAVIGDATIPIPRTLNPSESGTRMIDAILNFAGKFPGLSAKAGAGIIRSTLDKGEAAEQSRIALQQIQSARPASIKREVSARQLARERLLADFIGRYAATPATRTGQIEAKEATDPLVTALER